MLATADSTVELRRTSRAHAGDLPLLRVSSRSVLDRAGVVEGQPFILAADGTYDLNLNRFLRELDSWGVTAKNSIAGYSRDVMLFCTSLAAGSRSGSATART